MKVFVLGVLVAILGAVLAPAGSASASAKVGSLAIEEYRKDFDVSRPQAEEVLEVQNSAAKADVVGGLEDRLDSRYAGIWFDNEKGEFVVPVLAGTGEQALAPEFDQADLGTSEFRTSPAQSSWEELEAAQRQLDQGLFQSIKEGFIQTFLDPRTNAVVITQARGIGIDAQRDVQRLAAASSVEVDVRTDETERFGGELEACSDPFCGSPLRGGVKIYTPADPNTYCTAGFPAIGTNGNRYLVTAGHCVELYPKAPLNLEWASKDNGLQARFIGVAEQWENALGVPPSVGDWAKIKANGSFWDTGSWTSEIAYWGTPIIGEKGVEGKTAPVNLDYPITGEAANVVGDYACHSGIMTGTSCGFISALNVTITAGGLIEYGLNRLENACSIPGDSGGPYFIGHSALGLHVYSEGSGFCGKSLFYSDILKATAALKVSIAPPAPHVTISATALNGNPGWATVKGGVQTTNGIVVNGKTINVKLFKWESNAWSLKATLPTTVNNNNYEIKDWNGVGPGQWLAKAVFPAQGGLGESTSDETHEGSFTVKDGYRIVNKNSGKCLDVYYASKENGASTKQQYCADPTVFENQVFTLAPEGNGYLRLKPRHSGGCLEIAGASQENTALLQQWACNGSAQQSWQPVTLETVGGTQYIRLIAKHSGKCLDVLAGSKADGASVGQWECNTTAQQKWSLQSVDSAPVATETFATAPEYERLNGQPGYATVRGWVKTGYYGIPAGDNWVNLNYEKEVSPGNFSLIKTNHPTLNSEGFYEVQYEGLAAGNWRIWTGFQGSTAASPALAASQSPKVSVQINSGYRFVFRHSGKCLTLSGNNPAAGTPIVQWACNASASPGDGQVFTLVPMGNGYFEVKVNSSGRCLDVKEWSQSPGTWLRQYDCWGPEQSNQLWQVVPIAGQSPWNAFMVKHSGQCADVYASSTANGANVVQWYCNWGGQQQWSFQGVN